MPDSGFSATRTAASPAGALGRLVRHTFARAAGRVPAGHDWALWHRACAGDAPGATELVRLLTPQAHAMAQQMLGNTEDAQDVVQESFLRLWGARPSDAQGARLSTFFNTIVLNRCRTLLTQRREISTEHEALTELSDAQQQQHAESAAPEPPRASAAQISDALTRLPARQRMALAMWAYADADAAAIARALDIETNAAHQLLFRAKAALRQLLTGATP